MDEIEHQIELAWRTGISFLPVQEGSLVLDMVLLITKIVSVLLTELTTRVSGGIASAVMFPMNI
jgi:hypothetical protein